MREETARALDRRLAASQSRSRVPSMVAGLVRAGHLVWFGGCGVVSGAPPTNETQYRCGSISKTFIAVEVMRLRDEGVLDIGDQISAYLPELSHLSCTVAQLLSHTSGLRAESAGPWWERTEGRSFRDLVATSIRREDVLARPGRRFHYSNVGFAVLGELISRLRKGPWDDVVADELLRPCGMLRTTTRPVPPSADGFGVHPHADLVLPEPEHDARSMGPAGQLWTSVEDLSRWACVLSGERPDVLSRETAAEMREPVALCEMPDEAWTSAHGLGIQLMNVGGRRHYGHGGSMPGFLALLTVEEKSEDAVIVMANATSGLERGIDLDLLDLLAEKEPAPVRPWQAAVGGVESALLEILGPWYWGTRAVVLSLGHGGELELRGLEGRESAFRPLGDGIFVGLFGYYEGERLTVVRRPDGSLSHLDIGSFVFTRRPYDPSADVPGGVDPRGWVGSPPPPRPGRLGHPRRRD